MNGIYADDSWDVARNADLGCLTYRLLISILTYSDVSPDNRQMRIRIS